MFRKKGPPVHRYFLALGLLVVGWVAISAPGSSPISNWTAPSAWTPPGRAAVPSGGIAQLLGFNPLPFTPIAPCRQYDSRSTTPLLNNTPRTVTLTGAPCPIPSTAQAVSANITIFNITGAGGNGVFKVGPASPPTSAWINYPPTETQRNNAGVLPLSFTGAIAVQINQGAGSVDFTVDVNGYYDNVMTPAGYPFVMSGNSVAGGVIVGSNNVGPGVRGFGLFGSISGVSASLSGSAGVFGNVPDLSQAYGVKGKAGGSGVFNGYPFGSWGAVGVGGDGGVWGQADPAKTTGYGVMGESIDSFNTEIARGILGYKTIALTGGPVFYGVFSNGDIGGTGAKLFIEPHPSDAEKVIRYVALEGPEAGTYFRGTARTAGNKAVIEVPESFRIVTDEEGLTVQLTPVGDLAILAVMEQDLNRIVVKSSAEVSFHYQVNGVRRAFKNHEAIAEGSEFRPASARSRMPSYLTEEARRRLVQNGTYNQDGTVNLGTARRFGWTKVWEKEERTKNPD